MNGKKKNHNDSSLQNFGTLGLKRSPQNFWRGEDQGEKMRIAILDFSVATSAARRQRSETLYRQIMLKLGLHSQPNY